MKGKIIIEGLGGTVDFRASYYAFLIPYLRYFRSIVRSYLNEEIKCNDNFYTRYFNGLYTTYKVTRNYELSLVEESIYLSIYLQALNSC